MTPQEQQHINAYLRNELSEEQQQEFLASLAKDESLKEAFKLHKQLFESLGEEAWSQASENNQEYEQLVSIAKSEQIQALKSMLANTTVQQKEGASWKVFKNWKVMSAAAVLLALVGIFSVLNSSPNYQDLFDQYWQQTSISSTIERGDLINETAVQIELAHREQDYPQAILLYQSVDVAMVKSAAVFLYAGDSHLQLGAYNKALEVYQNLINSDLLDAPKGYWFKALAYLKMEDIANTRSTLEYIVANNLYNSTLAKELLAQL